MGMFTDNAPASQHELNNRFLSDLFSSDSGISKTAAADLNEWLHTYQRQDGVWRKVLPTTPVTQEQFAEALDTRDPFIIRPIVPNSLGATTVNFDTGTATYTMYAEEYAIYLQRIMTPKYRIDKIYLTAYKGDLIAIFKDLMLQDVLATEDIMGVTQLNAIVGEKGVINTDIGIKQYIDGGAIDADNVIYGVSGLTLATNNLNPSQALVHRSFWWSIIRTFKAHYQGDRLAEDAVLGRTSVIEESLAGISWKTALEQSLIPRNVMYVMAEPRYCGEFVTYEDATIFTKVEDAIWFECFAHETIGMQFANRAAAVRVDFGTGPAMSWTDPEESSSDASEEEGSSAGA